MSCSAFKVVWYEFILKHNMDQQEIFIRGHTRLCILITLYPAWRVLSLVWAWVSVCERILECAQKIVNDSCCSRCIYWLDSRRSESDWTRTDLLLYTGTTASRASHLSESVRVPLLLYNSTAPTTTVLRSYTYAHLLPYLIVIAMPIALFRLHVTYCLERSVISGLTSMLLSEIVK